MSLPDCYHVVVAGVGVVGVVVAGVGVVVAGVGVVVVVVGVGAGGGSMVEILRHVGQCWVRRALCSRSPSSGKDDGGRTLENSQQ